MHIERLVIGAIESNCYILWNKEREAMVIDPGADSERILDIIKKNNLKVVAYPLTHGHYDHISQLNSVYTVHPAPIGMHSADASWAFESVYNQYPPFYPLPERPKKIERTWVDGQRWKDAGFEYEIIQTPGHSPGSVCFYFEKENILIAGDTLFKSSIGRTDLPGSNPSDMTASLRRLKVLPDAVKVFPGHGPPTDMGTEKIKNPFLIAV